MLIRATIATGERPSLTGSGVTLTMDSVSSQPFEGLAADQVADAQAQQ
jgi:hypothetical protein